MYGPLRVFPGRLSVCRTFGDVEAKNEKLGGNPNVVIAEPDIFIFDIDDDMDFIILGSDGIYDKMSSEDVIKAGWDGLKGKNIDDEHEGAGWVAENVI